MRLYPGAQITDEMERIRNLSFEERRTLYLNSRITNQLNWYLSKARSNRRNSRILTWICVAIYTLAIIIAGIQFYHAMITVEPFPLQWVTEPILVMAASLLGWIQAKRYSELAASYTLAVHEISKIRENISRVTSSKSSLDLCWNQKPHFLANTPNGWHGKVQLQFKKTGAAGEIRTLDLSLTKGVLYP